MLKRLISGYHSRRQRVGLDVFFSQSMSIVMICAVLYSVGKTSLMNQYVNKRFSNQYKATIGADLCVHYPCCLSPFYPR